MEPGKDIQKSLDQSYLGDTLCKKNIKCKKFVNQSHVFMLILSMFAFMPAIVWIWGKRGLKAGQKVVPVALNLHRFGQPTAVKERRARNRDTFANSKKAKLQIEPKTTVFPKLALILALGWRLVFFFR